MAEKKAKYDLPDFLENRKRTFFWKSHISVKLFLFDLKIWLQWSLNKGYRIDIVGFKYDFFYVTRILYEMVNPLLRPPKNVDANISIISRWNKIPDIGFDRAKSPLQNLLSHRTVLYSFSEIFRTYFETLFLPWTTCNLQKKPILDEWKLESYIWADARHLKEQEYIVGINFRPWNIEKMNTTRFRNFLVFMNYSIFQLNL